MYEAAIRALITLLILFFACLAALTGLGFMVAALYIGLSTLLLPVWAAALTGLTLVVLALVMLLALRQAFATRKPAADSGAAGGPSGQTLERARRLIEEHTLLASGGAFSAGFYLGVDPRARRALWELLLTLQTGEPQPGHKQQTPDA